MSKIIDISHKLTNEKSMLKLSDTIQYEIDDRKNTVLVLNQKLAKSDLNDLKVIDEIIRITLGDKAAKEIDKMNLRLSEYQSIVIAIMATISGMEFEEAERRFQATGK